MADVTITLTIPDAKVADFETGFLAKCPVPMIGNPANPTGPYIPEFTDKQWIKEWLKRQAVRAYKHGKQDLAEAAAIIDSDVIE